MISIETNIPKSNLFQFEPYWIQHPGFMEVVESSWNKITPSNNYATIICRKFKALRYELKRWSKQISKLVTAIANSNAALSDLDALENKRALTIPESNFRRILNKHLLRLLDYQKQYWRKRCTIRWATFGDEDPKFFKAMASELYRGNSISSLQLDNGTIIEDHIGKEALIYQSFKERLGTSREFQMKFELANNIKKRNDLDQLAVPFTKEEIDVVIKELPADRAPGPDGFTGLFLKSCWHIIKEDFYELCDQFHEGTLNLKSINDGYITLIPKISSLATFNDFSPITLLNCCLKVITKLLANRLQKLILKIIHRNQYGFIKGRAIQDFLAWAFEYIHQCQTSKNKIVLLKLDFAKAFDTIEHDAMLDIMKHMG